MRLTKIYFKRFKVPLVFLSGLSVNILFLIFFSFYNSEGTASPIVSDNQDSLSSSQKNDSGSPGEEIKTEFVALSHIQHSKIDGPLDVTFFYKSQMFTSKNSPYKIEWRGGRPFAEIEIKEEEKKTYF